jgi:hypothetical protein
MCQQLVLPCHAAAEFQAAEFQAWGPPAQQQHIVPTVHLQSSPAIIADGHPACGQIQLNKHLCGDRVQCFGVAELGTLRAITETEHAQALLHPPVVFVSRLALPTPPSTEHHQSIDSS